MLLNFVIDNYRAFGSRVTLSLEADMRTKKFLSNVHENNQGNALKSLAIYGPNNTGKTCVITALSAFKSIILNRKRKLEVQDRNLFSNTKSIMLGAEFLYNKNRYEYYFMYDPEREVFVQERFCKKIISDIGNKSEKVLFFRNTDTNEFDSDDAFLRDVIKLSSKENILINSIDASGFPLLQEAKEALISLASSIFVIYMDHLSPVRTIQVLKKNKQPDAQQIIELIKKADLDIDDFRYDYQTIEIDGDNDNAKDNLSETDIDASRLISTHNGISVPSIDFDSLGTKKIVSIASYIVHVLNNKGILVIDELDSGIHFKLSRAIASLFNNLLNDKAQFIFTTHDVSLLDLKTLFRKEQICFTDKDRKQTYLYSLADFPSYETGIRAESNIYENYKTGKFGALPEPSLVDILLDRKGVDE